MSKEIFFFDTYAFFEVLRGNPSYERFKSCGAMTSIMNLAELNYGLKKEVSSKIADKCTEQYRPFLIEIRLEDVKEAMSFKHTYNKLSIPDAVGYVIAQKHKIRFLTGDEAFRNLEGVEFVK